MTLFPYLNYSAAVPCCSGQAVCIYGLWVTGHCNYLLVGRVNSSPHMWVGFIELTLKEISEFTQVILSLNIFIKQSSVHHK